jgi:DNA topoisomerase-2
MDEDLISVLKLYAHEVSAIAQIKVEFVIKADENDEDGKDQATHIKIPSLERYVRMFYPSTHDHRLACIKAPNGDDCVLVECDPPDVDTLEDISHISFVNCIRTVDGGIHVKEWRDKLIPAIVRAFNSRKPPKKGEKPLTTSAKEIYPYLQIFVRCEVDRPKFEDQSKKRLDEIFNEQGEEIDYKLFNPRSKKEKEEWDTSLEALLKKVVKWNFVALLEEKISARIDRTLSRKEGSKKRFNFGGKADPANQAGKKEALQCTAYITEGQSAKTFVIRGISSIEKGWDYNGAFAVKGKFLNVHRASRQKINSNEEVQILRAFLGLTPGMDYSKEENFRTLNYGKCCLMTDQDDDGFHIRGLLLNFFYRCFPSLMERGYVRAFNTAVAMVRFREAAKSRCFDFSDRLMFYSNPELKRWSQTPEANSKKYLPVEYYKGLGQIDPPEAVKYFRDPKIVQYYIEGDEEDYMELGFGNETSNWRKEWISRGMISSQNSKVEASIKEITESEIESSKGKEEETEQTTERDESASSNEMEEGDFVYEGKLGLSTFVDHQLVIYHRMTLGRALPGIWDGLKESQRKILFGVKERNYTTFQTIEKMAGGVSEVSHYHHGLVSLQGAITKMCQYFVGSNNIPLLQGKGEIGTRLRMGKDAASSRYTSAKLADITNALIHPHDEALLTRVMEDNKKAEYRFFMPILPLILINGADGIGCGWSTHIPSYNPLDICRWIELWMDGKEEEMEKLVPWYRWFTGKISLIANKDGKVENYLTEGILERGEKGWWHIRELPVGLSTEKFKSYLDYLDTGIPPKKSKSPKIEPVLKEVRLYNSPDTVHFMILPAKDFLPDMDTRGNFNNMKEKGSFKNMVAIDENNYPHRFDSPEDILRFFCPRRLEYYQRRKKHLLSTYSRDLTKANNRYRFIRAVKDKKLDLHHTKAELNEILSTKPWKFVKILEGKKAEPSYEYLLSMPVSSMTVEKLEKLRKEKERIESDIRELESKTERDLWREDLQVFRKEYRKFLTFIETMRDSIQESKTSKKKK